MKKRYKYNGGNIFHFDEMTPTHQAAQESYSPLINPQDVKSGFKEIVEDSVKTFCNAMKYWDSVTVLFSDNLGKNVINRFINGSETNTPVILLSPKNIREAVVDSAPLTITEAIEYVVYSALFDGLVLLHDVMEFDFIDRENSSDEELVETCIDDMMDSGTIHCNEIVKTIKKLKSL